MYTLFFWIGIALLGLALYVYPSFWVHRMYEAYENIPASDAVQALLQNQGDYTQPPVKITETGSNGAAGPNVTAGPAGTADFSSLLKNMEKMLEPQMNTPDLVSLPSPTASDPTINASGARPQPNGAVTVKSLPQTAEEANILVKSGGLEQGLSFQNMKPSPVIIVNQMPSIQPSKNELLTARDNKGRHCAPVPDMREYIRRDMIPDQAACPPQLRCPDMRQYIRKDSIPCWACKLK